MKYGIYKTGEDEFTLVSTTIDITDAKDRASLVRFDEGVEAIVVVLGPNTPDRLYHFDSFFPRVLFRTKGCDL